MDNEILFSEKQRFNQWWIWLILVAINALILFGMYYQLILGKPFGNNPMSDNGLLITFGLTLIFTILFAFFRLDTQVRKDGIYVRFFPIHLRFRQYTWERLATLNVRKYHALLEYGGWGLRIGMYGKGKAYNVSGNEGLQLEFTNGKRLLIGTRKAGELTRVLREMGKL